MFDRAEILFSSGDHFSYIGNHAVAVCAVGTVEFFDKIQVIELLPVVENVVAAFHLFDAVDRKAGQLIKRHEEIRDQQRNDHRVNNRAGDQVLRAVGDQPAKEIRFQSFMCFFDRLFKFDAFAFDLKKKYCAAVRLMQRADRLPAL